MTSPLPISIARSSETRNIIARSNSLASQTRRSARSRRRSRLIARRSRSIRSSTMPGRRRGFSKKKSAPATSDGAPRLDIGIVTDEGDAKHVGRTRRSERHAGRDNDPLARQREALLVGDAAGLGGPVLGLAGGVGELCREPPDGTG